MLAEMEMWYDHRDSGELDLQLADANKIFYDTFAMHQDEEGTLARVQEWLCTFRPVLLQSKLSAAVAKRRAARDSGP